MLDKQSFNNQADPIYWIPNLVKLNVILKAQVILLLNDKYTSVM